MAYTDNQKATACELIKKNNGVIDEMLLVIIRDTLDLPKLPKMTLWRWWKYYQQVAPVADVTQKNNEDVIDVTPITLDDKLEKAAHKFIDHALKDSLLMWTNSKDAITAAAIAIDKMRLLRDMPTEIIGVMPRLVEIEKLLAERQMKFSDVVEAMYQKLASEDANVSQA